MSRITQGAKDDTDGPMAQSLSPTVQMPTPDPTNYQSAAVPPTPVSLHSLAHYYRTGEYADLEIVANGVERSVHKIIVCSESPVIKHKCSLGWGYRVELNQYDPETLERVLDFCYRRTYSDGEHPETVAPFLLKFTAEDIHDALEKPPAVADDVEQPGWKGFCTQCNESEGEENEGEGDEGKAQEGVEKEIEEEVLEEDEDEYLPDRCEIDYSSDDNSQVSDDEILPVSTPSATEIPTEPPQPPYPISLFINLKVYIAAKELQIPALQLLARQRFTHTVRSHWARFSDLPALIEQVYLRTDNGDHLRALSCQIVAAGYDNEYGMAFKSEIREIMARNGEFATDVLDTALGLRREWPDME